MQNITSDQVRLLENLRKLDPDLKVRWDEGRGTAAFVRGKLAPPAAKKAAAGSTIERFLEEYGELFGPPSLPAALVILRDRSDDLGWRHIEYQHFHTIRRFLRRQRLEVYGSRLAVHIDPHGALTEVQSSCWREISLEARVRISARDLRFILNGLIEDKPGYPELKRALLDRKQSDFPVMMTPQLVIYPWRGAFRLTWNTYAYGTRKEGESSGRPGTVRGVELGEVFVDAATAELFLFAPTRRDLETPDVGAGLGVTPLGGPYTARSLNIVRVDPSSTYKLRDTTHARDILTFDLGANSALTSTWQIKNAIHDGTLPVSQDTDGSKNWNRLPADTSAAERTASQQPEVDAHFFGREAYEWYNALAGVTGRAGWDDNQYDNPPVPPQPVRSLTHMYTSHGIDAWADYETVDGLFYYWLVFCDGDPSATCATAGDRAMDYLAGSKMIFGHEYQHAITVFSFTTSLGRPGLSYYGWLQAVQEGLSDTFGCLFAEHWNNGSEIAPTGLGFRNLAFPRDPNTRNNLPYSGGSTCGYGYSSKDHFGDRDPVASEYDRGTILAHCAYLMGQGGVHQRASRTPVLIPVMSMGRESLPGKDVLKAARIWYRALTWYFSTHGALTDSPENDENTFRTLRDACESSAIDIHGEGSMEHRTTVLAFYAVGLHPPESTYGADVTFLRWGSSWRLSRPHLGGIHSTCPDWSSLDLYVNNGGGSEWNALINVNTPTGPTDFENMIYCRVRNVGNQPAENVQVQFEYAKAGTGMTSWDPVTDKDGNPQILDIGTLGAGQSNFPESQQDSPPASAGVKWHIPPLAPGELVNHFCLRATVTSSNDVNVHNNVVNSNIAYVPYTPAIPFMLYFMAGNPMQEEIPLKLVVQTSLPRDWRVKLAEDTEKIFLKPGEERMIPLEIVVTEGADQRLEPPFDGKVNGELFGPLCGPFEGALRETTWDGACLRGRFSAALADLGTLTGIFDGKLNTATGEVTGRVNGKWECAGQRGDERLCAGVRGCLRPLRRIDLHQVVNGEAIGGITVQVQVPMVEGPCAYKLPPTDPWVPIRG